MPHSKALSLFLMLTAAVPAAAQVFVFESNGIAVQMTARMEPGSVTVRSAVKTTRVAGRYHRMVLDPSQRRYFGYDLLVEPKDRSGVFQIRIEPFSLSPTEISGMLMAPEMQMPDASWTLIPLLKYPVVPDVRVGDTVAVDLLENLATGQKVVDYLTFKSPNRSSPAELSPLRDLSLADIELHLENVRISMNGSLLEDSTRFGGGVKGAALWFYLPDRGRFVLSLLPNAKLGFRRAGEVSHRSLTFTDGDDRYDVQSTSSIVPAAGRFNLYLVRDPNWRPIGNEAHSRLIIGAADRAEWLIPK